MDKHNVMMIKMIQKHKHVIMKNIVIGVNHYKHVILKYYMLLFMIKIRQSQFVKMKQLLMQMELQQLQKFVKMNQIQNVINQEQIMLIILKIVQENIQKLYV